ncbi:hypothetical protein XMA121_002011 [Marinobacterium sp. xm-a-121]|nr:hypothetical protein [Marinobacterium sp. xm-a-121]NRQ00330.1 hypothetical protein [Marinobacterium sp. xm-v-233]
MIISITQHILIESESVKNPTQNKEPANKSLS